MFLDTFAWVEYFQGTARGREVRDRLDRTAVVYASPMVLAEVYSKFARTMGSDDAERRVAFILAQTALIEHTGEVGLAAGRIHAEMRGAVPGFGMADAFILAAARSRGVRVLTGDPHFEDLPDADLL
jgi:predicted nucleic acid-binding protein